MSSETDELDAYLDAAGFEGDRSNVRRAYGLIWMAAAGDELRNMLVTPQQTEAYLQHPSWKLRLVAISILKKVSKPNARLAAICEKMASEDPHEQVRGVARETLAEYKLGKDVYIRNLFARTVCDETMPRRVREAAYRGLCRRHFGSIATHLSVGKLKFPEDVDWEFVKTFL
jgi:hypothetical protein